MAEASTLARPYAQAIFELATSNNTLKLWSDSLEFLKEVTADKSMVELISNPDITNEQVISLMLTICQDGQLELDKKVHNFLKVAAENGRLDVVPHIAEQFEVLCSEEKGSIDAHVVSTYTINTIQKKSIIAALKQKLGREVTITTQIDKSLLGGVIIHAGDMVIDGSVKSQLEKITNALLS